MFRKGRLAVEERLNASTTERGLVRVIGRCTTGLGKIAASERRRAIRDRVGSAPLLVLPARALAAMLSAGVSNSSAGDVDKYQVRFEIYGFAGFHVLTNRTTVEESANRYASQWISTLAGSLEYLSIY
jgi:hypothetical protein